MTAITRLRRIALLAAALLGLAQPALAASTINPNVPAANAPVSSAPIRNNFSAAYSDVNKILGMYAGTSAPTTPVVGQDWLDTTTTPAVWKKRFSTGWTTIGTINLTTGVFVTETGVTPAALTKTDDTNVTLTLGGTPATALLQATSITVGWAGALSVPRGGTGVTSGTSGGVPYFSASTTIASSAALTANMPVFGGGAGAAPFSGTRSGNTTVVVTTTGAQTSGNCVMIDVNGNHVAAGSACGLAAAQGPVGTIQTTDGAGSFVNSGWLIEVPTLGSGVTGTMLIGSTITCPTCSGTDGPVILTGNTQYRAGGHGAYYGNFTSIGGTDGTTMGAGSAAFGTEGAIINANHCTGIGNGFNCQSEGSTVIGHGPAALAGATRSVAIGNSATATGESDVVIGNNASTLESSGKSIAVGSSAVVRHLGGISIGAFAAIPLNAVYSIALGYDATSTGPYQAIIGGPHITDVYAGAEPGTATMHAAVYRAGVVSSVTGQLSLANSGSAFLTTIRAGAAAAARTYTWPTNFGAAGTVLTDAAGDGTLSWAAGGGGGGSGTVTSVALALPAIFTVSGSPVTTAGTLTGTLATQTANTVFAGPVSGGAATPAFRAVVAADITGLLACAGLTNAGAFCSGTDAANLTGTLAVANGGTGLASGTSGGVLAYTASGTLASSGALTANLPVIGGGAGVAPTVGTRSGNTTAFVTTTGAQTSGDCVSIDASGNHIAAGAACGGGGSSGGNPTASVGLTAVNGSASTFLRSDGAPALDQAIAPNWTGQHTYTVARTIASGASAVLDDIIVIATNTTVSGATNITTATGFNKINIEQPTITAGSALTVTNAATLRIADAPLAAGSATITNPYALWVDAGATRLDGTLAVTGATTLSAALTYGGVTLSNAVTGTGNMVLSANPTFTGTANFSSLGWSSVFTGTSTSPNAFAVGRAGLTNPTIRVDPSTASSATGILFKSAAAAGGMAVSVISSGADEALTIDAKGAGTITFGSVSTGAFTLTRATTASSTLVATGLLTATVGVKVGSGFGFYPTSDSTAAVNVLKADNTTVVAGFDTSNKRLGVGITGAPIMGVDAIHMIVRSGAGGTTGLTMGIRPSNYVMLGYNFDPRTNPLTYLASDAASAIEPGESITFLTAPSGTAGNAITFTAAFKINASGTASTSTTTGTGVLTGGLGVSGAAYIGGAITGSAAISSISATAGIGYATGAGGTVTQATSRSTGVTINKVSGQITTTNSSIAAITIVTFTVTNSAVAATDTIILSKVSGDSDTSAWVSAVAAGSFDISLRNNDAVAADTTAFVVNFTVIKGVTSWLYLPGVFDPRGRPANDNWPTEFDRLAA